MKAKPPNKQAETPQLQHTESFIDVHVAEDLQHILEYDEDGDTSHLFSPCKGYDGYHVALPDDQDNEND